MFYSEFLAFWLIIMMFILFEAILPLTTIICRSTVVFSILSLKPTLTQPLVIHCRSDHFKGWMTSSSGPSSIRLFIFYEYNRAHTHTLQIFLLIIITQHVLPMKKDGELILLCDLHFDHHTISKANSAQHDADYAVFLSWLVQLINSASHLWSYPIWRRENPGKSLIQTLQTINTSIAANHHKPCRQWIPTCQLLTTEMRSGNTKVTSDDPHFTVNCTNLAETCTNITDHCTNMPANDPNLTGSCTNMSEAVTNVADIDTNMQDINTNITERCIKM